MISQMLEIVSAIAFCLLSFGFAAMCMVNIHLRRRIVWLEKEMMRRGLAHFPRHEKVDND